jgi:hypothetical protein
MTAPCLSCTDLAQPCGSCPARRRYELARDCPVCEDAMWLIDAGEIPEQVAVRVGRSLPTLERHMQRHGRPIRLEVAA